MSFQAFSSTPATNSRASSRSTTVPPSDEETQGHPANVGDAGFHSTRYGDVSAATSRSRSKRPRNTESQDEAEYPSKRIRLRRSSAKTLRAVNYRSVAFRCTDRITTEQFAIHNYRSRSRHPGPTATPAAGYVAIWGSPRPNANARTSRKTRREHISN
jgi:hypothetical protein